MGFDFTSYLSSLYPGEEYEIQVLLGGLVNHTVRARRTDTADTPAKSGSADGPKTAILKYAPPYVASIGEDAPFSQDRQLTEASALRILGDGYLTSRVKGIKIPRVLSHDPVHSILIIEDLGPLITLWDFLESATNPRTAATAALLGHRVGAFFAELHRPSTLAHIHLHSPPSDLAILDRAPITAPLVRSAAVEPIRFRLRSPGGLTDAAEADALYARVVGDFERANAPAGESCLSIGDCHPGAILVDPVLLLLSGGDDEGEVPDMGVIDWEFSTARRGRGANGDAAQFLASVHALWLSLAPGSPAWKATGAFGRAMCEGYAEGAGYAGRDVRMDPAVVGISRSALILHGRELINQAVERPWGSRGRSVAEMVREGIWYLERAGDGVDEMLEQGNWDLLMGEESGFMLRLFGLYRESRS
ncbi:kinase-like domain-containing protein [Phialemonium atrogriseum]|uniref:Kinase-like domain-containing protein n=1 Tax=Phialemonium atrogriseum TaxID=1093897 RepID=A0AAJ0BWY4_9PEZI|nr:kinase-like domain-containing protein [Phialemonium atrogriseum]KAK1765995.1 kinase-like domain-containing protein [Phialemonium atrogriseum]